MQLLSSGGFHQIRYQSAIMLPSNKWGLFDAGLICNNDLLGGGLIQVWAVFQDLQSTLFESLACMLVRFQAMRQC